ncbi:hypothetical protein [Thermoanaerobacter indiensis]|nr:hypothetical protein [Thermoanaerobacter indiensis]
MEILWTSKELQRLADNSNKEAIRLNREMEISKDNGSA